MVGVCLCNISVGTFATKYFREFHETAEVFFIKLCLAHVGSTHAFANQKSTCLCMHIYTMYIMKSVLFVLSDGYTGDVYLLVKLLLPTAGKKRVYNLQSKQIVKLLSQVNLYAFLVCGR